MNKYGRKPAVHNLATMKRALVMARHLTPLGTPPAQSANFVAAVEKQLKHVGSGDAGPAGADWLLLANGPDPSAPPGAQGGVGDCVIAADYHAEMTWEGNTGHMLLPNAFEAIATYSAETGYDPSQTDANGNNPTDQGTDIGTNMTYLMQHGLLYQAKIIASGYKKIVGKAQIDPTNTAHVKWAIQIFGGVHLGIQVPDYFQDAFSTGVWGYVDGQNYQIEGGHDIWAVAYDSDSFEVITWGRRIKFTDSAFTQFVDQVEVALSLNFVKSTGLTPAGFNAIQLAQDLQAVSQ